FAEPRARGLVLRAGLQLLIVEAIDQQPRQRRLVQLDREPTAGAPDEYVGRDVLRGLPGKLAAWLGVVSAKLADHVGEVLVVYAADALEVADPALGQQVEVVDQPRHRGVEAVRGPGLQREALSQRPRADARRVQSLHQLQCFFDER